MSLSAFDIDISRNERRRAKPDLVPCADGCGSLIKKRATYLRCISCGYKRTEEAKRLRDRVRKRDSARAKAARQQP